MFRTHLLGDGGVAGDNVGEAVSKGSEGDTLDILGEDNGSVVAGEVASGGAISGDNDVVAQVESATSGRVDAHVGHETGNNEVIHVLCLEKLVKVSSVEAVRVALDDDGLALHWLDGIHSGPDGGLDIVGGSGAGVVLDMHDGDLSSTGTGQKLSALLHGLLDVVELHDAFTVGILDIYHHEGTGRESEGLRGESHKLAKSNKIGGHLFG